MYDIVLATSAKNEERYIGPMLLNLEKILKDVCPNYKIIVIDVSSTDRTGELARAISEKNPRIEVMVRKPRARGKDIMLAFSKYDSRLYCHVDTDLSRNVKSLRGMVGLLGKYDVVIGSKYMKSSKIARPWIRHSLSVVYNRMLSVLFDDHIGDHQCGFKLFNRKAYTLIKRYTVEPHWTWDTEMVLISVFGNLKIREFPLDWRDEKHLGTATDLRRGMKDIADYTVPVLRMFYRFRVARVVKAQHTAFSGQVRSTA